MRIFSYTIGSSAISCHHRSMTDAWKTQESLMMNMRVSAKKLLSRKGCSIALDYSKVIALLLLIFPLSSVRADVQPKWITEGPYVNEASIAFSLPVEVFSSLLFVEIEVGGSSRRFLFDTGSPSMMSRDLVEELGLEVVDKRQGRDSHGAIVESDIVQADFTLGGTTFHNVPVFVTEFPRAQQCLFDGVLGSEVLPLCAWQIDLPESALRCNSEVSGLGHIKDATKQTLYSFGYPHAPIVDVRLAENARSKALLDTGTPEYFFISPSDFEGAKRNGGIQKIISGVGSIGASIGGRAPDREQHMVQLSELVIGGDSGRVQLNQVRAPLRASSPSLIGSSIMQNFIVTLDMKNSLVYFERIRDGSYVRQSYGFGFDFDEAVSISAVWDDSPASAAGLRVGQRITSINGQPIDASCDGIRRAMRAISNGNVLELGLGSGNVKLTRDESRGK